MKMSKMATLELQRKGALDLADALFNENKRLKKQKEYATGYTMNLLMEHNVSGTFIKHYEEQYGENKWINISYVKELLDIIALPPHSEVASLNRQETKEKSK